LLNSKLLATGFTRLIHNQCVCIKHDIETNKLRRSLLLTWTI
jgi:hypothetical protein